MRAGVSALRRFVFILITGCCLAALSCADRESPTSPASSSNTGKATISGTLLAGTDSPPGAAAQPLAGASVRVAATGQTAQTDAAGNFSLPGVSPGAVALEIRGSGIQASTTVNASAGVITRVTVTVNRGRSTVNVSLRSEGLEGVVDSINVAGGSFVLKSQRGMVTISTDANTQFRMRGLPVGFGDLKVGQRVEVEGSLQTDGTVLARKVEIEEPDEEETRTPRPSPTATTTPPTATPTPTATTTPATATPTRTPRPEQVELEGTVASISGTSFVLTTRSGPVTVQTNAATQFRKEEGAATFADIKVGGRVEVEGTRQIDGSVLASRVRIEEVEPEDRTKTPTPAVTTTGTATTPQPTRTPTPSRTPEPREFELDGTVGSISGTSFVLMTRSGPATIQTNAATEFKKGDKSATFADIKVGGKVEARGTVQTDGTLLASRVSIEKAED